MLKSHVCFNIDFSVSDYKIKVCISSSCNAEIFEFNFQARHSRCVCKTMRENLMNRRIVQVIGGCDFIAIEENFHLTNVIKQKEKNE